MIAVKCISRERYTAKEATNRYVECGEWLSQYAGPKWTAWRWEINDAGFRNGIVLIQDEETAVSFKIKFGI